MYMVCNTLYVLVYLLRRRYLAYMFQQTSTGMVLSVMSCAIPFQSFMLLYPGLAKDAIRQYIN